MELNKSETRTLILALSTAIEKEYVTLDLLARKAGRRNADDFREREEHLEDLNRLRTRLQTPTQT